MNDIPLSQVIHVYVRLNEDGTPQVKGHANLYQVSPLLFGFLILSFRISVLGFRVSGVWCRVEQTAIRFRVSDFGFQVSGFGFRVSGIDFRVPVSGLRVSIFWLGGTRYCPRRRRARTGRRPSQS